MKITSLEDVLADELKDIYSAETQLIRALPELAAAAGSKDVLRAFEKHLDATGLHVQRILEICEQLNVDPHGRNCLGMEALIREAGGILRSDADPIPREAALIGAAQRIEHYEISACGTAQAHARQLGFMKAADILGRILEEEKQADELLTALAENRINVKAAMDRNVTQTLG